MYRSMRLSFVPIVELPDVWNECRRSNHGIARLAAERRGEGRYVRQRAIRTPTLGGMLVDRHAIPHRFRSNVAAPALRVAEEETLLRRESLDQLRAAVALQGALQRVERRDQTAVIGDVLAERE